MTKSSLCLEDLLDRDGVAQVLRAAGMDPEAACRSAAIFARIAARLGCLPKKSAALAFFVPGRVEVLGKHTDYCGGKSLVCALERGLHLVAIPGTDSIFEVSEAATGASFRANLGSRIPRHPGHWSNYVATVAQRLSRNFPGTDLGGRVSFSSNLPRSAGMSSSSALIVGIFLVLRAFNDLSGHPCYLREINGNEDLAGYLGCVENGQTFGSLEADGGVGTLGGSEDHTAILCSETARLGYYSYSPRIRRLDSIRMPPDHLFALAVSGVRASKARETRERYNRLSVLARHAARAWQTEDPRAEADLAAILASPSYSSSRMDEVLGRSATPGLPLAALRSRVAHFVLENQEILPAAVCALQSSDLSRFAELVALSQQAAQEKLGNQVPETIHLAHQAPRLGAVAASAFGAGFGGSVWALVRTDRAAAFLEAWEKTYREAFPKAARRARFFTSRAGPAAFLLSR